MEIIGNEKSELEKNENAGFELKGEDWGKEANENEYAEWHTNHIFEILTTLQSLPSHQAMNIYVTTRGDSERKLFKMTAGELRAQFETVIAHRCLDPHIAPSDENFVVKYNSFDFFEIEIVTPETDQKEWLEKLYSFLKKTIHELGGNPKVFDSMWFTPVDFIRFGKLCEAFLKKELEFSYNENGEMEKVFRKILLEIEGKSNENEYVEAIKENIKKS